MGRPEEEKRGQWKYTFADFQGPNHYDAEFKGLIPRTIEGLF
jgi:hypothetical protein